LFSAFGCALFLLKDGGDLPAAKRSALGFGCRNKCSKYVEQLSSSSTAVCNGLGVGEILLDDRYWDDIAAYCSTMAFPVTSKRQWGGYAELVVLAFMLKVRVWIFVALPKRKVKLICAPIGALGGRSISIVWRGGCHYDALHLPKESLEEAFAGL